MRKNDIKVIGKITGCVICVGLLIGNIVQMDNYNQLEEEYYTQMTELNGYYEEHQRMTDDIEFYLNRIDELKTNVNHDECQMIEEGWIEEYDGAQYMIKEYQSLLDEHGIPYHDTYMKMIND